MSNEPNELALVTQTLHTAVKLKLAAQEENEQLRMAVGLLTTLKDDLVMDAEHPVEMAQEIVEHVRGMAADKARLDWLDAESNPRHLPVAALVVKADYDRNSAEWVNIVGTAREAIDAARSELISATDDQSCDNCQSQEGRHYCLLHSRHVKNMDAVRCKDWSERAEERKCNDMQSLVNLCIAKVRL